MAGEKQTFRTFLIIIKLLLSSGEKKSWQCCILWEHLNRLHGERRRQERWTLLQMEKPAPCQSSISWVWHVCCCARRLFEITLLGETTEGQKSKVSLEKHTDFKTEFELFWLLISAKLKRLRTHHENESNGLADHQTFLADARKPQHSFIIWKY